jgi:Zn-finger nucleic acid-binding protein
VVASLFIWVRSAEVEDKVEAIKCPKCQVTMREREQGSVIVDICPQCRGVWLDPGELEKLSVRESRYYEDDDDDDWDDQRDRRAASERYAEDRRYEDARGQARPRKKKGFLASMMENFGGEAGDD